MFNYQKIPGEKNGKKKPTLKADDLLPIQQFDDVYKNDRFPEQELVEDNLSKAHHKNAIEVCQNLREKRGIKSAVLEVNVAKIAQTKVDSTSLDQNALEWWQGLGKEAITRAEYLIDNAEPDRYDPTVKKHLSFLKNKNRK